MADRTNQHFVPQFYFRLFNGGRDYISLLHKASGRIIPQAAVKKQAARRKYYGDPRVELLLQHLENLYAPVLHRIVETAGTDSPTVSNEDRYLLDQMLLVQRARTPEAVRKHQSIDSQAGAELLAMMVEARTDVENRQEIAAALRSGLVRAQETDPGTLAGHQGIVWVDGSSLGPLRDEGRGRRAQVRVLCGGVDE